MEIWMAYRNPNGYVSHSPMPSLDGQTIILGVTGSIAAYKAADIASELTKLGASVFVVMTKEATQIIAPLTLQVCDGPEGWTEILTE